MTLTLNHYLAGALLVLFACGFSFFIFYTVSAVRTKGRMKKTREQGQSGEKSCEKYLKKHNYKIIEKQPVWEGILEIDNKSYSYSVRPDFLVRKGGKQYILEVKKGKTVSSPLVKEVRRQLLEYLILNEKKSILFFDGTAGTLHKVVFPSLVRKKRSALVFLGGMAAGIAVCLLVYTFQTL